MVDARTPDEVVALPGQGRVAVAEPDVEAALDEEDEGGALVAGYPLGSLLACPVDAPLHFEGVGGALSC